MRLRLERPIMFFDLETTGTNILRDRIVEISMIKVYPDGHDLQRTVRVNPGMPIPAEATAVHHITDADIAAQLAESLAGCDIAGFNSNRFDVPMLAEEFARVGVDFDFTAPRYVDVQTIFHKKEQRTLSAAYRFYCDKDLEGAHSANADTRATYEVLLAQLECYADLPCDIDGLSDFSMQQKNVDLAGRLVYDDQHREVINFGKYKGQLAADVLQKDPGYYNWIQQGDFPSETKRRFTAIRMRHHR